MSMTSVPGAVATRGNLLVLWVPENGIADPNHPTEAELTAPTVKDLTYSLTPGGYNRTQSQARERDERLTLPNVREKPGEVTRGMTLQYVHGADDDVADVALKNGVVGYIVERRAVKKTQPIADDDKVTIIKGEVGEPSPDAPASSGSSGSNFTKTTEFFVEETWSEVVVGSTAG